MKWVIFILASVLILFSGQITYELIDFLGGGIGITEEKEFYLVELGIKLILAALILIFIYFSFRKLNLISKYEDNRGKPIKMIFLSFFIPLSIFLLHNIIVIVQDFEYWLAYDDLTTSSIQMVFYGSLTALFVSPWIEEFVFRKYLFSLLSKKIHPILICTISGALFSLLHYSLEIDRIVVYFVLGFLSMLLFIESKNIWYSIILHFVYNLAVFFSLVFFSEYLSALTMNIYVNLFIAIVLLAFIIYFAFRRMVLLSKHE